MSLHWDETRQRKWVSSETLILTVNGGRILSRVRGPRWALWMNLTLRTVKRGRKGDFFPPSVAPFAEIMVKRINRMHRWLNHLWSSLIRVPYTCPRFQSSPGGSKNEEYLGMSFLVIRGEESKGWSLCLLNHVGTLRVELQLIAHMSPC